MVFQKLRAAWQRFKKGLTKKKDVVVITSSIGTSTDVAIPVDYEVINASEIPFLQKFLLKIQDDIKIEKAEQQRLRLEMAVVAFDIKQIKASIASKKGDKRAKEEARGVAALQVNVVQVKLQEEIPILEPELKNPFPGGENTWTDDGDSLSIVSWSDTTSITRFSTSPRSQCNSSSLTVVTELSQSVSGFFSPREISSARSSLSDCSIEFLNDGLGNSKNYSCKSVELSISTCELYTGPSHSPRFCDRSDKRSWLGVSPSPSLSYGKNSRDSRTSMIPASSPGLDYNINLPTDGPDYRRSQSVELKLSPFEVHAPTMSGFSRSPRFSRNQLSIKSRQEISHSTAEWPTIEFMFETKTNPVEEILSCSSLDFNTCKSVAGSLRQKDIVSVTSPVIDDDFKFPINRPDDCRGESRQQNPNPCEPHTPIISCSSRSLRTYSYQSGKESWREVSQSTMKEESSVNLKTQEIGPLLNFTPFDLPRQRRVECYSNHFMNSEREQIMGKESRLPNPVWPSVSPKDHQQVLPYTSHINNTCKPVSGSLSSSDFTPSSRLGINYGSQTGINYPTAGPDYFRSQSVGLFPHMDLAYGKSRTLNDGNTTDLNGPSHRPRSVHDIGIHSLHSSTRPDAGRDKATSEFHINLDFLDEDDDQSRVGSVQNLSVRSRHPSTRQDAGRDKATSEFHINLDFLDEDDDQSRVGSVQNLSVRSRHPSTRQDAGRDKATLDNRINNLDFLDNDDDGMSDGHYMHALHAQRTVEYCESPDIVYRPPRPSMVTYARIGESGDTCTCSAPHSHTGASGTNGMTSVED
ncbi:unnamed protein product [Owenia fusiformis]|uniref:Uncharacterized protein n=1 Tax=Owenia fusiformis TaxID=6347 RepID=A0A8J1TF26_OWEFU|nr:unnamed protein product [Owenia fusiformis]